MNWERISGWCWTTAMISALAFLAGVPYSGHLCLAATLATIPLPFPNWKSFGQDGKM